MPVRKIPPNYLVPTGYFYSIKNSRLIAFESPVERDYYQTLEFEDNVLAYEEQPLEVKNGKSRPYYPDCLVTFNPEYKRKQLLVEVKTAKDMKNKKKAPKIERKIDALKKFAESNNMDFMLVLDEDIRNQYLDNIKFIYRYSSPPEHFKKYEKTILEIVNHKKTIMAKEILDEIAKDKPERALILPCIWHLIWTKSLKVDLDIQLSNSIFLEVNN